MDALRFWNYVEPELNTGCWLWSGADDGYGYGALNYQGKVQKAHRVSWALENGPIPAGLRVLHHCDTPACLNPAHLFLGTQADNVADMRRKGRANDPHGARNFLAKLTSENAVEIRRLAATGMTQRAIGRLFGVAHCTVGLVVRGETWVGAPMDEAFKATIGPRAA